MDRPPIGQHLGPYELTRRLGEGGVATVYQATHRVLGSTHAVKLLHVPAPSARRRLMLEGRIQASVRHPHIVPVTDTVEWNGLPGLVLEFVDGPHLGELLAAGPLSLAQLDDLATGLFAGVGAVHAAGFVHRDLKPANVLIQAVRDGGRDRIVPRLADFGLARAIARTEPGDTHHGVALGTPAYMAPEQVLDARDADQRADLWSLGCMLYELATGRAPFRGASAFDTMSAVRHVRPTHPRDLRPELPERMVDAILGCLVKDRKRRVETVDQLTAVWTGAQVLGKAMAKAEADPWAQADLAEVARKGRASQRKQRRRDRSGRSGGHLDALVSDGTRKRPTHLHALIKAA